MTLVRTVGNLGCDFHTAIDWARSHDQDVVLGLSHSGSVHRVQSRVLVDARKGTSTLAFELNAKQVQHITSGQNVVQVVRHFESEFRPTWTDQGRWSADDDVGTRAC